MNFCVYVLLSSFKEKKVKKKAHYKPSGTHRAEACPGFYCVKQYRENSTQVVFRVSSQRLLTEKS